MAKYRKLSHIVYYYTYHIVWTPKYRFRVMECKLAEFIEEKIRQISKWYQVEIEELHVLTDHVHFVCSYTTDAIGTGICRDSKGEECNQSVSEEKILEGETILKKSLLVEGLYREQGKNR